MRLDPVRLNVVRALLRATWAFCGLLLSLPAFMAPLIIGIFLVVMVAFSGGSFLTNLRAVWSEPTILLMLALYLLYVVYWLCVAWLLVQFVIGRKLSRIPLGLVSIAIVGALVVATPWRADVNSFGFGPWSMLQVAFMLTIVWASLRRFPFSESRHESK
jgi:hypothetical protein